MNELSRRSFLNKAAKVASGAVLLAAGVPISASAAPIQQEYQPIQDEKPHPFDQYIAPEIEPLGNLEIYNGAKLQLNSDAFGIDRMIPLHTHTQWKNEAITPPVQDGSVFQNITGAKVMLLHSSYSRTNGIIKDLPGEPFRAILEGTRDNGFIGDIQIRELKKRLLLSYPLISASIDGNTEQFYAANVNIFPKEAGQGVIDELFKTGNENTLKIFLCGLSAHQAVKDCETILSRKKFALHSEAREALDVLQNPHSTSQEVKHAVLNTCTELDQENAEKIVATYMGAREVIVDEQVNGRQQKRKIYENILKKTLESMGIYYYSDRRIVWTLEKL